MENFSLKRSFICLMWRCFLQCAVQLKRIMNFLETLSIIVFLLIGKVSTQSNGCDFYQELELDIIYTISSPRFPQRYLRGTDCRWAAEAPAGYKISLDCYEVRLPPVFQCTDKVDRILVSSVGNANLTDGKRYCGGVPFTETSSSTRMVFALKTGPFIRGGRFKCSLKAVRASCSCGQLNRGRIGECCRKQFVKASDKYLMFQLVGRKRK